MEQARRRKDSMVALLFMDLDRFKNINDSLGHSVGDELLIELARRLTQFLRPGDTVARLGGDEFVILLNDVQGAGDATRVAERVQDLICEKLLVGGREVFTSASIGVALSNSSYKAPEEILRDADTAMYRAKAAGRGCYQVFDQTMHRSVVALLRIETELRQAVENKQFVMHYQPIISLEDKRIVGFEGLVRWRHPERGLVSPSSFIAVAEETGLIVPLGWWVLEQACRHAREWQRVVPMDPPLYVSVNVSGKVVMQPDMYDRVVAILEETGLAPTSLRLEITENVIMDHGDLALQKLAQFHRLGVQFSVDDFGTGYSSLSYLQRFSYDTLKIDRSFISGMDSAGDASAIVKTIVALANMLNIDVVAEGVETAVQLEMLREIGFFPGFVEAMERLQEQGFRPVLLSHNSDSVIESFRILLAETGLDLECLPARPPEKIAWCRANDAAGLIDDAPETLLLAKGAGIPAFTFRYLYNAREVDQSEAIWVLPCDGWPALVEAVELGLRPDLASLETSEPVSSSPGDCTPDPTD